MEKSLETIHSAETEAMHLALGPLLALASPEDEDHSLEMAGSDFLLGC